MTGGCCRSSRRSGTRPARRSSTSCPLQRERLGVGDQPEPPDFELARLSTALRHVRPDVGVEVLELLLDVGHELIGHAPSTSRWS